MSERPPPIVSPSGRPFWDAAKAGSLVVPWCPRCGQVAQYGRPFCPVCLMAPLSWRETSGTGVVYSYTVVRRSRDAFFAGQVPYTIAIVELEDGVRLLSNIVGMEPSAIRIGMPVRVTFEQAGEDLVPLFEPVGE